MIREEAMQLATKINASNAGAGIVGVSTIPGAGLGLFATRHYNTGEFVAVYNGEAVYQCLYSRSQSDGEYVLEVSPEFVIDAKKESAIVTPFDTGRYICGTKNKNLANCRYYITEYGKMFPVAYVMTTCEIRPGEEFLVDYGPAYEFQNYQEPQIPQWEYPSRRDSARRDSSRHNSAKPVPTKPDLANRDSANHTKKCKFF